MENLNCIRNQFGSKRLLILGFAREGIDTLRFLRKLFPNKVIGIADRLEAGGLETEAGKIIKSEKKVKTFFGTDYLKSIGDYDVIIKAPGISPKVIKPFLKKTHILTSQTEIFF
ncbi:MAG: hypothetical protein Q8N56_00125, partial [bacterium]|nr:hypothetical protein [bacterium]